jgi:hypothetical protein
MPHGVRRGGLAPPFFQAKGGKFDLTEMQKSELEIDLL